MESSAKLSYRELIVRGEARMESIMVPSIPQIRLITNYYATIRGFIVYMKTI